MAQFDLNRAPEATQANDMFYQQLREALVTLEPLAQEQAMRDMAAMKARGLNYLQAVTYAHQHVIPNALALSKAVSAKRMADLYQRNAEYLAAIISQNAEMLRLQKMALGAHTQVGGCADGSCETTQ